MVHFHVRPARSVTYWPSGVLFVCVTCVLPHPFVCARSWRASVSCLARFPGAHLVLCVNSSRAVVVGVGARVYSFLGSRVYTTSGKPALCWGFPLVSRLLASRPAFLLVVGEEFCHALRGGLVHVACSVEVALGVVEGSVGDAFFGVCAVPGFAEVLCAAVDVAQQGFDGALVFDCCRVVAADSTVPFVVYEAGAVTFDTDGDGHRVEVADIFGEVSLLFVGERVPRVGERLHDGEVCGAGGEERCGFCDLVDVGVHGWASFSLWWLACFLVLVLV